MHSKHHLFYRKIVSKCKIPTHIYMAQVPNGNQLLRIMWGGVRMNIFKKSKN